MTKEELKQKLEQKALYVLAHRLERLEKRKVVLFPWLRIKWLMQKFYKMDSYLGG